MMQLQFGREALRLSRGSCSEHGLLAGNAAHVLPRPGSSPAGKRRVSISCPLRFPLLSTRECIRELKFGRRHPPSQTVRVPFCFFGILGASPLLFHNLQLTTISPICWLALASCSESSKCTVSTPKEGPTTTPATEDKNHSPASTFQPKQQGNPKNK